MNTQRETIKINSYEEKRKIRTNIDKFKIVQIESRRKKKIRVGDREVEYSDEAKALGVTIATTGFSKHARNRIALSKSELSKLFSFRIF